MMQRSLQHGHDDVVGSGRDSQVQVTRYREQGVDLRQRQIGGWGSCY